MSLPLTASGDRVDLPAARSLAVRSQSDPSLAVGARLARREPPQYLSSDQVRVLIDAIRRPRTKLLAKVLYQTGARISEALALLGADIDLENRRIRIPTLKQRRRGRTKMALAHRWMPMPDGLAADVAAWLVKNPLAENERLFPIGKSAAWQAIRKAGDKAGLAARGGRHVSPHILRHSYAARLMDSGVPLAAVKELMGHEWVTSTMVYLRVADSDLKDHVAHTRF
jgi:integrase/recombinase XerD